MKMKNKKTLQWLRVLQGFASSYFFVVVFIISAQAPAGHAGDSDGGTRIDCGARGSYTDPKTNSSYEADDGRFVEFGEVHNVLSNYSKEQIGNQLKTSRSFPEGKRNCYSVPTPSQNPYYLVRAFFAYGNKVNRTGMPSFDLHIGVNYWETINPTEGDVVRFEVIHVSPTDDDINVCLVNTGHGTPFISLLEVLPWRSSRYDQTPSSLLRLMSRSKLGMSEEDSTYIRYPDDDIYGRSWFNRQMENTVRINTSMAIDSHTDENTYKLPKEVLSSAVQPGGSSPSLDINMNYPDGDYYVYLHFYDFENKSQNQQRKMVITFSDGVNVSFTLQYLKPTTLVRNIKRDYHVSNISIRSDSQLPAMLNAYEIYRVLPQPANSTTDKRDVAAIRDIKRVYGIKRVSWQGDPCMPMQYTWEGLSCNNSGTPRITSINLSSSNLSGEIARSFSNFTELTVLDLSNNSLTGKIPEFLAEPEKLKYINLTRNKLTGPIPKVLVEKKITRNLTLSTDLKDHRLSKAEKIGIVAGATGGAAVVSGVTLTFALRLPFCWGRKKTTNEGNERRGQNGRRGQNDDERRSGKKEEEPRDDESNKESGGVTVKPTIPESLVSKASEAIQQIPCL
ncbi:probable LRR receptor-like serine/threonine-protein kinase PAM74 [Neltuma alba]|uniref:probable LRR receptor-like serine/threonine-protein kinase PAM74 n=1 Tax=Neltuma alba TaxID=207710 RepID=UPI0010A48CB7|nr:probable LRR receptor-like serine/threonine-protein kinase PAM74 [Prosopis alba]